MQYDNVTILLQGIINDRVNLYDTLSIYTKLCPVVLSIYTFDIEKAKNICESFPTVKIVENNLDEYSNLPVIIDKLVEHGILATIQRMYFQICTTKKGLEYVTTEYVVKSRVDHYYSSIHKLIDKCIATQKITSSSIFTRGCLDGNPGNRCRFCFSDCLFMGRTDDIRLCFELCFNAKLLSRPETAIWAPYFIHIFKEKGIDIELVDDETYMQHMLNVVQVCCINELGPYKLKLWDNVYTALSDSVKTTYQYLMYGCDF
jgi:hypothetical protein